MCSKCSSAIWGSPVAAGLLNSGMCTIALGESRVAAELDAEVPYFRYHPLRHLGASILDHCGRQPEGVQKQQGWFPVDWPENAVIPDGSNDRDKLPPMEIRDFGLGSFLNFGVIGPYRLIFFCDRISLPK
jgi:hypothetical protein